MSISREQYNVFLQQFYLNVAEKVSENLFMDSFFASVDVREKPELEGLPVVVGADPKREKDRDVVCTCSYEARKYGIYGIHSAMPVSQAYKLRPDATFLPVNIRLYV